MVALVLIVSCGGPYKAKQIERAGDKLELADDLFARKKYKEAAAEYKDFLAVFAGNERGDYAQFKLAECYRFDEDYPLAAVEYRILINDYGYSDYIDDAFFLEGLCAFMQKQRPERDQTKTYEALGRIKRFLQLFPDSPRREEAEATILEIYEVLGAKEFKNGKLYYSRKHYNAAAIYFDKIIENYSSTVWAARSRYYRGMIYEIQGSLNSAMQQYGEAVSSSFDFDEKKDSAERLREITGENDGE